MKVLLCVATLCAITAATPTIRLRKDFTGIAKTERIINGRRCDRKKIKYQASIMHKPLVGVSRHICGGALISKTVVLTAAHCKQKSGKYNVYLGQLNRNEIHKDVQKIPVKEFIVHDQYPGGIAKYDIGVLLLSKAARISLAVEPVSVPKFESDCEDLVTATLSGWGVTDVLVPTLPTRLGCAELPVVSNEECGRNLTDINGNSGPLDDTMICTGTAAGKKPQSTCTGDSGGPLVARRNNTIVGIVSWGVDLCGTEHAPSVYTRVCEYIDWINDYLLH